MSWLKKAFGVATILGGSAAFGCSGTTQLVGSDGLTTAAGNSGGGNTDGGGSRGSGTAPVPESINELTMLAQITTEDERPYLCMPEELPIDAATGNADCHVLLARPSADCNCAAAGLSPASAEMTRLTHLEMKLEGFCDTSFGCDPCVCEVDPAVGTSLQQCQTEPEPDANTTGWCYVSATAGAAQGALVEACINSEKQRLRFFGPVTDQRLVPGPGPATKLLYLSCPMPRPVRRIGDFCVSDDEYRPSFAGYSVKDVNIEEHAAMCTSGMCIQNHFQGRASCPYGQAEGGGGCLAAGSYDPVTVPVAPQLESRQTHFASICSCQCAGPGPGPYCTCPEYTQCEHLVDELRVGDNHLAGSYCIPQGTRYDPQESTSPCTEGGPCGDGRHPYN